jgi:alpha-L-rhamnosidase
VATAYLARSAELVGQAAEVLGRLDEAQRYRGLAAEVRRAFAAEYVAANGRMRSDATTAYALALQFDLLPDPAQRQRAAERLVELVHDAGFHISTGFVGTPLICDALCIAGRPDAAYHLLLQRENPSWLYPVTMGATTIWERWDSMLPDGSINPGEMTSFNHYALGAIADWLHRSVAGLAPAAPGYRRILIRPLPGGGLTHAAARHITPYGLAASAWRLNGEQIELTVVVPPNTTAEVVLPGSRSAPVTVGAGTYHWSYHYHDPDAHPTLGLNDWVSDMVDNQGSE